MDYEVLIRSIKDLEVNLSNYRDEVEDNRNLSILHFAISEFITNADER